MRLLLAVITLALATGAHAYDLLGSSFPSGNIAMRLQLDVSASSRPFPLTDGSTSWDSVAQSALEEWNPRLNRSRFTFASSTTPIARNRRGDGISQVFFASSYYDQGFDNFVLAVTLIESGEENAQSVRSTEADVVVNQTYTWNSFRGPLSRQTFFNPEDLRRVLLHEFGHVLGLSHPDQATPVQRVAAMMNSTAGDTEVLQPDDIAGANYLYNTPFARPVITTQPVSQTATISETAKFTIGVNGQDPPVTDDFHSFLWYFKAPGSAAFEPLFTLIKPGSLMFSSVQLEDAGSYYFQAITPDDVITSNTVTLTTRPTTVAATTQLANLSTRGLGGASPRAMIVGFVITGSRPKSVLLRAAGPTLAAFGVARTLADPQLLLKNAAANTIATSAPIWDQSPNTADIRVASLRVGAFALPAASRDAVILTTLPPGNYTATTSSPSNTSGTVLIEVYDADLVRDTTSRIANLSTRGYVTTGTDTLISGFVVQGPGPRTYLLRVSGPSLTSLGVTSTLEDPYLKLFSGLTLLREKDDWDSPAAFQPALNAAFGQVGAFAFPYPSTVDGQRQPTATQPAMLVTLQPGAYSAQVTGLDNRGSTNPSGNALIEIYELP